MIVRTVLIASASLLFLNAAAWGRGGHAGGGGHGAGAAKQATSSQNHSSHRHRGIGGPLYIGGGPYYYGGAGSPATTPNNGSSASDSPNNPANGGTNPGSLFANPDTHPAADLTFPHQATDASATPADPALAAAAAEVDAADDQLKLAVSSRPDYQAALAEKNAAEREAAELHEDGRAKQEEIMSVARRALDASQKIAEIKQESRSTDPQLIEARDRVAAANAKLTSLASAR